jgi:hypothetical protein
MSLLMIFPCGETVHLAHRQTCISWSYRGRLETHRLFNFAFPGLRVTKTNLFFVVSTLDTPPGLKERKRERKEKERERDREGATEKAGERE